MRAIEISRTGLDVEWRRLEIIAENLANMNTVVTANGGAYQPQHLISGPRGDFAAYLDHGKALGSDQLSGVMVYSVEELTTPPRIVHEPSNPQADANGDVTYPGIDHAAQMTLMVKTERAYEANIVALNAARQMYSKALQLGARS